MGDLTISSDILKDSFTHDATAAALNHTTSFGTDFRLSFVAVNRVGTGGANDFEIYFDSTDGATFDVLLSATSLGNNDELIFIPPYDMYFKSGDEVRLEFPNLGGSSRDLNITIQAVQE
jgi:hypothetical protein